MSIGKRKPSLWFSQRERRDGRKNFKRPPHPTLSRKVEREGKKRIKGSPPHPCPLPQSGEGIRKMKRFKHLLTLPFPAG
jgi:hypothetical protein